MKNHSDNHQVNIRVEANTLFVTGALTQTTVMDTLAECSKHMNNQTEMMIDLMQVSHCDSASLAFVLALLREGQSKGIRCQIINIPLQMKQLSRVSGLDQILQL